MNYSVESIVPSYQFHSNSNISNRGNRFAARPIRHWRKQLQATNGLLSYRKSAIGMPMDRPGGENVTKQSTCQNCNGSNELKTIVEKKAACTSCYISRTGISVNPDSFTNSSAYLQSKCITYDQKLAYNPVAGIDYFSSQGLVLEPSNSSTGPQVRETDNCYSNNRCNTTIYKPNNSQFAQQGGVSSGSRISRLKYNTINHYGAEYHSAAAAADMNKGIYMIEANPSYYNKIQPQKIVYNTNLKHKKTYCRPAFSMCSSD